MVRSTEVEPSRIHGEVSLLEQTFTRWLGVGHALALSSGVTAVELALRVLGLGNGDRVLVDAFADAGVDAALARLGIRAIPVDVEEGQPLMDPSALARVLGSDRGAGARAVLVSHRTGHPAKLPALEAAAQVHGLPVIEDASEAVGAALMGRRCGGIGRIGVFCLGPDRTFSALGPAGLLVTDDPALDARARDLAATLALSMDGLRAGVARLRMRGLEGGILRRQSVALRYDMAMAPLGIRVPRELSEATHVYDQYLARVPVIFGAAGAAARDRLVALGMEDRVLRPLALRNMGEEGDAETDLPNALTWCRDALSLPVYAQIPGSLQSAVIAALTEVLS
ncbi:MAG: DegT/DnrJ/EryC1/StrS family aminotransferase [Rhodospirillum sp.]|nr:DegT/DnrJ/EryC1/StrS family aminotransferase [Rhodospirillum sp.]MCF8488769.1 DegT/DnrJ/EryC1/StrS family aminotransferase [Rhodospirillum sp.]MCF8499721.1 DegT/DnrJ/EryC1/StrS family aminotransferase [Rhodospirillum sp.]